MESPDRTKVLVTGASGFVASHCIKQLQELGYQVRGTVRNLKDEKKIEPLYKLCPSTRHKLELVEADLMNPNGWKEAVSGCKYVLHVASPFPNKIPDDEQELIKPAVEGTLNVLKACVSTPGLKRVVLTSSMAAMVGQTYPDYSKTYSEDDWTDLSLEVVPYQKSKTLAEKAAWDFLKQLPAAGKFELAVINPTYVMGPICHGSTGTSQEVIGRLMKREIAAIPNISFEMCDVRDVAAAHIKAMTLPEADGQRFLINSGVLWFKDIANILDKEFKDQGYCIPKMMAPKVVVSVLSYFDKTLSMVLPRWGKEIKLNNTKMRKVLGIEPWLTEKTIIDMAYSMIENGLVPKAKKYVGQEQKGRLDYSEKIPVSS